MKTISHTLLLCILCFTHLQNLNAQGVGIGTTSPDPSAKLEISSSTQGTLITRMNTVQRDAIVSPAEGLLIFNTTTKCFEAFVNAGWYSVSCPGACALPANPTALAGSNIANTSFTASWNAVPNATTYFLDVATDSTFNNFVNGYNALSTANVTSYAVSGLAVSTTYYYRLRASNTCGNSIFSNIVSVTTSAGCSIQAITAVGNTVASGCGSNSFTINKPSGVSNGDVLIAGITNNALAVASPPAGWIKLHTSNGGNCEGDLYYHIAGSGEPSSYTWTFTATAYTSGSITAFRNVDNANPIEASSVIATSGYSPSGVVTQSNDDMLVLVLSSGNGANTWSTPSGWTADYSGGQNCTSTGSFHMIMPVAGSSPSVTATASTGDTGNAYLIALKAVCQ